MREDLTTPPEEVTPDPVEPEAPPAPLLELSDGLPPIIDTREALEEAAAAIAAGTGLSGRARRSGQARCLFAGLF